MRIRSIKPEFWSSEDIAEIQDWGDRLLFVGLWSYVDDNGVGRDNPKLIVADLFPLEDDPRETLARVSRGLQTLSELSRIVRYTAADGKDYLQIANWQHQRIDKPNKPRYPTVTSENAIIRESLASMSRDSRETPAPGTGEQGNRGTGDTPQPPAAETDTGPTDAKPKRGDRRSRIDAMNETARPIGVYRFMHDYERASATPIDQKTLSQIETAITPLLAQGIPAEQVASGLRAWEASDSFSATQIASFVHKAGAKASAQPAAGNAHDAKVVGYLDIGRSLTSQTTEARRELA